MENGIHTDLEMKLRSECEQGRTVGEKTPFPLGGRFTTTISGRPEASVAPTGEPFTEVYIRKVYDSDQEAYAAALAAFAEYAADRPGTLYWRTYPEIDRGRFYMRLLISDQAVLHFG